MSVIILIPLLGVLGVKSETPGEAVTPEADGKSSLMK